MRLPGAPRAGRGAQALLILVGARRLFQLAGRYDHDAMVRRTKLGGGLRRPRPPRERHRVRRVVQRRGCIGAIRCSASALPTQPWEPRFARAATTLSANA